MKKPAFRFSLLTALLILALPLQAAAEWLQLNDCRLVPHDANDGDSFHFESGGREYIARLYFADCAETDDQVPKRIVQQMEAFGISEQKVYSYGQEAKKFTDRVLAHPFTVVTRFQDARGRSKKPRYYAFVFPQGSRKDLGSLLIEAGLARSFGQVAKNDLRLDRGHYDQLQARAQRQGMGVWGGRRHNPHFAEFDDSGEAAPAAEPMPGNPPPPANPADRGKVTLFDALNDAVIGNLRSSNRALLAQFSDKSQPADPAGSKDTRINLNTAAREQIEMLPGIGQVLAGRIIENRPYRSAEDLKRVPRLGAGVISKIAPLVEF